MAYTIRASASVGAIATHRDTPQEAYMQAKQYEAEDYFGIVIKTPDGTEYGVAEFYRAMSTGGGV